MDTNHEMIKNQQKALRELHDEIAVLRATLLAVEYVSLSDGRRCPWCNETSWSGQHRTDCMRQKALRWPEK